MTPQFSDLLFERLAASAVSIERFREIVAKLYAVGVIYRPWSIVDQRHYDDAVRIESTLIEYFELAGFRLYHDREGRHFRLYPPGASTPAEDPVEGVEEVTRRLRAQVSRDFAGAALALRFLYSKAVLEGTTGHDEEATVTVQDLAMAMQSAIGWQLPKAVADRTTLFRQLRLHRLLRLPSEIELAKPDAFIAIQRTILSVISDETLRAALDRAKTAPAGAAVPPMGSELDSAEEAEEVE